MSARPYTLAHVDDTPDIDFPSLRAMAAWLVGWRASQPPGDDGEPQRLAVRAASLHGRAGGFDGACVSVRLLRNLAQLGDTGPGRLIAYAFLPEWPYVTDLTLRTVMAAIDAEQDARDARAAAPAQKVAA